jgi:hypothetical protein
MRKKLKLVKMLERQVTEDYRNMYLGLNFSIHLTFISASSFDEEKLNVTTLNNLFIAISI